MADESNKEGQGMNRRDFLVKAGLAVGGAGLAGVGIVKAAEAVLNQETKTDQSPEIIETSKSVDYWEGLLSIGKGVNIRTSPEIGLGKESAGNIAFAAGLHKELQVRNPLIVENPDSPQSVYTLPSGRKETQWLRFYLPEDTEQKTPYYSAYKVKEVEIVQGSEMPILENKTNKRTYFKDVANNEIKIGQSAWVDEKPSSVASKTGSK